MKNKGVKQMANQKSIQAVYNKTHDKVIKVTEYEYTGDGLKKVSEKSYVDKPEEDKVYSLTGAKGSKCIANGNSWKDSEFKD